jgi:putative ATP-dependent endonuclease of OLD family
MRLDSIDIRKFRSIDNIQLCSCGGFNVLIGKNNSGKSNVLSAINTFFHCILENNVVTMNPPIGQDIDFFEKKLTEPIQITIIFSITLAERDSLIRDIVTEASQMKNAVDGLDPSLRLSVTLTITPPPSAFAFVSQVGLVPTDRPTVRQIDPQKILFGVSQDAARELFAKLSQARISSEEAELLTNILPEIERFPPQELFGPNVESRSRAPLRYIFDRVGSRITVTPNIMRQVESLLAQSSNLKDFSTALQNHLTRRQEETKSLQDEPLRNRIVTFAGEQPSIPQYVKNLLSRIASSKILYLKERRKQIGREEAAKLLSLKVTRGGPQVLRNIQETVSALLGVQIDAFQTETGIRKEYSLRRGEPAPSAEMDLDNFIADVNGSGVREALRIVLDFEFEHPKLLLIEEPEIYLHPSLETSMMRYLKRISSDCQVFISTHSTNFLDTGEMKNVYLVSKTNSTQIQLLDYEEAESQIPRELGIRLSSLFMFDRIIFVEGPSDEAVIREWASTLRVNLSNHNVGFVHMGGVRNFTHYAAEATLSFLTKRQVKMYFIIDRDERDDEEISKLQRLAGPNASVKVLERRELENYLICPRALVEFIGLKRQLSGITAVSNPPTETDVTKLIDESAEKLKQLAIGKHTAKLLCRPVYPDIRQILNGNPEVNITDRVTQQLQQLIEKLQGTIIQAAKVYEEQLARVETNWLTNKQHVVPGDVLLDLVSQAYGVRFKKEQDSQRLARIMIEAEIPQEIQQMIREIGT